MSITLIRRATLGVVPIAAVVVALAACGSTTETTAGCTLVRGANATSAPLPASGAWPYSNGDLANTRDAVGSTISSSTLSKLRQAWTFKLTGKAAHNVSTYGSLAATPIVEDGVVYFQDLDSNVYAISLTTGSCGGSTSAISRRRVDRDRMASPWWTERCTDSPRQPPSR